MPVDYEGPRDGDRVQIEAAGTVVEVQVRDDVPGALIELDHGGAVLWLSGTARPVLRAQERTSAVDGSEASCRLTPDLAEPLRKHCLRQLVAISRAPLSSEVPTATIIGRSTARLRRRSGHHAKDAVNRAETVSIESRGVCA